jgi:type IV pilus assembly protein PilC
MATYQYVAKDALGKVITGTSEAENEQILVRRLREKGFWVQKVNPARTAARPQAKARSTGGGFSAGFGRVSGRDLAVFCRQFATMIDAGVSLVRCLAVLEEQSGSARLRGIIREIQAAVESGETLSRSLTRWPKVFNNLFVGLVRAGEVGGVLDETLNRLATFMEENERLRRKVKSAMTYPVLVLIFATAVVIGMVTFILPQFVAVFNDLGIKDLPRPTEILIQISHFLTEKWYMMIGGVFLFFIAFSQYTHTRIGKRHFDWVKLKMPIFGKLNHKICIARFSRTLSTLLVSGVPILQALETVAGTVDNEIMADAIMASRAAIREGEQIGDPLQRSGMFPPMVVQMVAIGEETGSLDQMLSKIADFYESEVDSTLAGLTAALEPILIVSLGFIVGFIVISMFMPLIHAISSLQSGGME